VRRTQNREGKVGLHLCKKRRIIQLLPIKYDNIYYCGGNAYVCVQEKNSGVYNAQSNKMVINMEYDSISQCECLESIKFGNGLTVVKGVDGCRNLKEIIFSQNNVEIDSYAFRYNDALTELQIPDHIHTIREWAFQECDNLKSVNLGAGMKLIDDSVFLECINLESVYISAVVPPDVEYSYWGYWDVFYGCHENLLIYVPEESLNAYQTAEGWCEYADRIVGYAF
jgi:hypothetical protein